MRLLIAHQAYPPEGGGAELYTEALARTLARNHDVSVLYAERDSNRPDLALRETQRDGVRLLTLNNPHAQAAGFESYRDPRVTAAAARLLDERRPELLHVGHLRGLSSGLVHEARQRGIAVVVTLHDFWPVCALGQLVDRKLRVCPGPTPRRCLGCVGEQVALRSPALRARVRQIPFAADAGRVLTRLGHSGARRIERRLDELHELLRATDVVVSPSRFLRDRLASLGLPMAEFLPNGHPGLEVPSRLPDAAGRVRFGFLGAAIPSKGVHVLAEAFRRLADPRATLAIHGGFPPYHGDTTSPG